MSQPAVLFLLDWQPSTWSTREEFFRQLSGAIAQQGITPILTLSGDIPQEIRKRFEDAGAQVATHSYEQPLRYWAYVWRQARKYDVLLVQLRFFHYFTLLQWMCRLSGMTQIILTEANSGEWSPRRSWKSELVRLRAAIACWPVRKFIAVSEFIKARLIAVGLRETRIGVVYNGIDTGSYLPDRLIENEFSTETGTFLILFASSLLEWKRPDLAISVCSELVRRGVKVKLLMAGSGPMQLSLETMVVDLGIQNHVVWLGHRELQSVFPGVDLFLHTSKGEAFGNVLVEAMSCGIPIVATRSGATPEVIEEGITGLLIDPGVNEIERMADAIQSLWIDSNRRAVMGTAGVHHASKFTTKKCVQNTLSVYSEITGNRVRST